MYAQGRSWVHDVAVLYVWHRTDKAKEEAPALRIGFVISKKLGKAVCRNRLKRRLREAVRLQLATLHPVTDDLVFVGRKGLQKATTPEIQRVVASLLRRAKVTGTVPTEQEHSCPP